MTNLYTQHFSICMHSEHGWNDPPPLPYKTLHSSNGQKRSHLNKRPCYPADSVQLPAQHSPVLCPPPTGLTAIPPAVGSIARNADSIGIANTEAQVSGTGPTEAEVSGSNATGTVNCSQLVDSLECLIQDLVTSGALQVCVPSLAVCIGGGRSTETFLVKE